MSVTSHPGGSRCLFHPRFTPQLSGPSTLCCVKLPIVDDAAGASQPQPQHCQQQEQQQQQQQQSSPAAIATSATHPYQDSSSKRIRRSSFPELDDAAYSAFVKSRRKQQAAERETTRGKRDRTGRRYPGREEVRRKEQEQLTAQRQRYGLQLAAQLGRPFKGPWSEEIPSLVHDGSAPSSKSRRVVVASGEARIRCRKHVDQYSRDRLSVRTRT